MPKPLLHRIVSVLNDDEKLLLVGILNAAIPVPPEFKLVAEEVQVKQFDFDSIYQAYPRKQGKHSGIQVLKRKVRSDDAYSRLSEAVTNYAAHCKAQGIEKQFIMQFSTFANRFMDWCDENVDKAGSVYNRPTLEAFDE